MHAPIRAPLVEVFCSIQGEGAFVGEPQSFVRLGVCPLRCRYCDSESTWEAPPRWRVAGAAESWDRENPASVAEVLEALARAEGAGVRRTVSITGGEPLVHADFLAALAAALRAEGRRVHLETAGVHPGALGRVAAAIDHVSADLKLASTLEVGDFALAQRRFFEVCARERLDTCVKCVVTPAVSDAEFDTGVALVSETIPGALFVVQPVTPMRLEQVPPSAARVAALVERAGRRLARVRAIPQVHRSLGLP